MTAPSYLIPDPLLPENDFCARVYLPDSPGYRRAFLGAYTYLATWLAWQRDEEHNAAVAARRMAESVERTLEEWGSGCGSSEECEMTREELIEIINEAIENMTITVTQNVNCGCGCGDGSGGQTGDSGVDYRLPIPDEFPVPDIDDGQTPINPSNAQKCSLAHYLIYTLRLTLLRLQEQGGDYATFTDWYTSLWSNPLGVIEDFAYQTWQWAKQLFTGSGSDVAGQFDEYYNTYVCALYSSNSPDQAYANLVAVLSNSLAHDQELNHTAGLVAAELPYQILFAEAGGLQIPVGFNGRTCCGETPDENLTPPPDVLPENYYLIPVIFGSVENIVPDGAGAIVATFAGNDLILQHSGATSSNVYRPRAEWIIDLNAMGIQSDNVHGAYYVPRVHQTLGNARTVSFVDSWGLNTATYTPPVNQAAGKPIFIRYAYDNIPSETAAIANYVTELGGVTVEDTANGTGSKIAAEGAGGSNPLPVSGDFRYSVWLLVKNG